MATIVTTMVLKMYLKKVFRDKMYELHGAEVTDDYAAASDMKKLENWNPENIVRQLRVHDEHGNVDHFLTGLTMLPVFSELMAILGVRLGGKDGFTTNKWTANANTVFKHYLGIEDASGRADNNLSGFAHKWTDLSHCEKGTCTYSGTCSDTAERANAHTIVYNAQRLQGVHAAKNLWEQKQQNAQNNLDTVTPDINGFNLRAKNISDDELKHLGTLSVYQTMPLDDYVCPDGWTIDKRDTTCASPLYGDCRRTTCCKRENTQKEADTPDAATGPIRGGGTVAATGPIRGGGTVAAGENKSACRFRTCSSELYVAKHMWEKTPSDTDLCCFPQRKCFYEKPVRVPSIAIQKKKTFVLEDFEWKNINSSAGVAYHLAVEIAPTQWKCRHKTEKQLVLDKNNNPILTKVACELSGGTMQPGGFAIGDEVVDGNKKLGKIFKIEQVSTKGGKEETVDLVEWETRMGAIDFTRQHTLADNLLEATNQMKDTQVRITNAKSKAEIVQITNAKSKAEMLQLMTDQELLQVQKAKWIVMYKDLQTELNDNENKVGAPSKNILPFPCFQTTHVWDDTANSIFFKVHGSMPVCDTGECCSDLKSTRKATCVQLKDRSRDSCEDKYENGGRCFWDVNLNVCKERTDVYHPTSMRLHIAPPDSDFTKWEMLGQNVLKHQKASTTKNLATTILSKTTSKNDNKADPNVIYKNLITDYDKLVCETKFCYKDGQERPEMKECTKKYGAAKEECQKCEKVYTICSPLHSCCPKKNTVRLQSEDPVLLTSWASARKDCEANSNKVASWDDWIESDPTHDHHILTLTASQKNNCYISDSRSLAMFDWCLDKTNTPTYGTCAKYWSENTKELAGRGITDEKTDTYTEGTRKIHHRWVGGKCLPTTLPILDKSTCNKTITEEVVDKKGYVCGYSQLNGLEHTGEAGWAKSKTGTGTTCTDANDCQQKCCLNFTDVDGATGRSEWDRVFWKKWHLRTCGQHFNYFANENNTCSERKPASASDPEFHQTCSIGMQRNFEETGECESSKGIIAGITNRKTCLSTKDRTFKITGGNCTNADNSVATFRGCHFDNGKCKPKSKLNNTDSTKCSKGKFGSCRKIEIPIRDKEECQRNKQSAVEGVPLCSQLCCLGSKTHCGMAKCEHGRTGRCMSEEELGGDAYDPGTFFTLNVSKQGKMLIGLNQDQLDIYNKAKQGEEHTKTEFGGFFMGEDVKGETIQFKQGQSPPVWKKNGKTNKENKGQLCQGRWVSDVSKWYDTRDQKVDFRGDAQRTSNPKLMGSAYAHEVMPLEDCCKPPPPLPATQTFLNEKQKKNQCNWIDCASMGMWNNGKANCGTKIDGSDACTVQDCCVERTCHDLMDKGDGNVGPMACPAQTIGEAHTPKQKGAVAFAPSVQQ